MDEPTNNFRNTEEEEKMEVMKEKNIERRSKTGSKKKKNMAKLGRTKKADKERKELQGTRELRSAAAVQMLGV